MLTTYLHPPVPRAHLSSLSLSQDKFDTDGSGHLDRKDIERMIADSRKVAADAMSRHIPSAQVTTKPGLWKTMTSSKVAPSHCPYSYDAAG